MARETLETPSPARVNGAYTLMAWWANAARNSTGQYLIDASRNLPLEKRAEELEAKLPNILRNYQSLLKQFEGGKKSHLVVPQLQINTVLMRGLVMGAYDAYQCNQYEKGLPALLPNKLIRRMDQAAELPRIDELSTRIVSLSAENPYCDWTLQSPFVDRFQRMVAVGVADTLTTVHGHDIVIDPTQPGQHVLGRVGFNILGE